MIVYVGAVGQRVGGVRVGGRAHHRPERERIGAGRQEAGARPQIAARHRLLRTAGRVFQMT